jgi:hypothetical protein
VTKRTEETMLEICDNLAAGLSYVGAATSAGVKPRTFWFWVKESRAGRQEYLIPWLGDERIQFASAIAQARKMMHLQARANFERRSLLGSDEVVTFQGAVQYVVDVRCVGWSEDKREAFGFRRDGLAENERGEVIPLTIHREPPIAGVLRMLEMSFPEYQPTSNVNSNVTTNTTQGTAMAAKPVGPPPIPPRPPMPMLEAPVEDGDFENLLGPEPEPAGENVDLADDEDNTVEPAPQRLPEPVIRDATPPELQPLAQIAPLAPTRPISPLLADLLNRAKSPPEVRSAPIVPGMINRAANPVTMNTTLAEDRGKR